MNDDEAYAQAIIRHARGFLDAARLILEQDADLTPAAFETARHAAELAGKALLFRATGAIPRYEHAIGGSLGAHGLIPLALDPRAVSRLVAEHTRARYAYTDEVPIAEAKEALRIASVLLTAAETWPEGDFHAARTS